MKRVMFGVVAAVLLLSPLAAQAQDDSVKGKFSITLRGGLETTVDGDLHEGGSGTVLGLPTSVDAKTFNDVYGGFETWRIGGGIGFGLTDNLELIGNVSYARGTADVLQVGTVAGLALNAEFEDYEDLTVEGGLRLHVPTSGPLDPYVNLVAGVRRVSAIPSTFTVPAASVTLADTPFYDDSNVPVVGGDVGVAFKLNPNVSLGAEAGLRWQGKLTDIEGLRGTGLENLNDVGQRWSVPVSAVLSFRF
jgi:opacity protein-like surface antigen